MNQLPKEPRLLESIRDWYIWFIVIFAIGILVTELMK